jgi:hypothetical protein
VTVERLGKQLEVGQKPKKTAQLQQWQEAQGLAAGAVSTFSFLCFRGLDWFICKEYCLIPLLERERERRERE